MKELSIEEKAKAYDEAIERAKKQLDGAKVFDYEDEQIAHDIRTTTYDIFPELKESEDLKKEITPSLVENMLCYFGVQSIDDMDSENLAEFAKHFFELGLKAQKGE